MIRLIACDIDGTLLQDGALKPRPELFWQIAALKQKGILFCPASGRQYNSLRWLFEPVADDIAYICENGGVIYQNGRVIGSRPLRREDAREIIRQILAVPKAEVLISGANTSYLMPKNHAYVEALREKTHNNICEVASAEEIPEEILKISVWYEKGAAEVQPLLAPAWKDKMQVAISGPCWMDFTVSDKGTGICDLCGALKIPLQDVMAFGDNYNDIPMLRQVGHPWLMDRAAEELRAMFPRQCPRPELILEQLLQEKENL